MGWQVHPLYRLFLNFSLHLAWDLQLFPLPKVSLLFRHTVHELCTTAVTTEEGKAARKRPACEMALSCRCTCRACLHRNVSLRAAGTSIRSTSEEASKVGCIPAWTMTPQLARISSFEMSPSTTLVSNLVNRSLAVFVTTRWFCQQSRWQKILGLDVEHKHGMLGVAS